MFELGFGGALERRDDGYGQHLAQLDAPLVERVDVPDGPLREHAVFVEGDESAQYVWRQFFTVRFHRQLLEVGREAFQVLFVGHHADRLHAEEVRVPHGQEPHEHRQVFGQRGGTEVLVHGVKAGQHLVELLRPRASIVDKPMAESIE